MSVCRRTSLAVATAGLALAAGASAQALSDPTRPPNAAAIEAGSAGGAAAATRLESVLIAPGRRIAVINGVTVPLGGKVGDATLVKITETEAVLRTGRETEVLKLLPGIERKPVKRAAAKGEPRQ